MFFWNTKNLFISHFSYNINFQIQFINKISNYNKIINKRNYRSNIKINDLLIKSNLIFVDTSILISYVKKDYNWLNKYLENKTIRYTETVKEEFLNDKNNLSNNFIFTNSNLLEKQKENAYNELCERYSSKFEIRLTDKQIQKFKNDMFILFESSYIQFKYWKKRKIINLIF